MRKKIKDLTQDEAWSICNRNEWCADCPLFATHKCLEFENDKYEREVEIDEK